MTVPRQATPLHLQPRSPGAIPGSALAPGGDLNSCERGFRDHQFRKFFKKILQIIMASQGVAPIFGNTFGKEPLDQESQFSARLALWPAIHPGELVRTRCHALPEHVVGGECQVLENSFLESGAGLEIPHALEHVVKKTTMLTPDPRVGMYGYQALEVGRSAPSGTKKKGWHQFTSQIGAGIQGPVRARCERSLVVEGELRTPLAS